MASPTSPFMDHAAPILSAEPAITDEQRASLWDTFHQTKDPNELAQKLAPLLVPDDLKHKLWQAKQAAAPVAPPVDKVTAAMQRMTSMDPKVLDVAEAHPNVLKVLTTAATTEPKEAPGATSDAEKGKTTPAAQKPVQPPRADGQPHFPAIPDGHHRVLASNGGMYDIPQEGIEAAQKIDPNLHVLNP